MCLASQPEAITSAHLTLLVDAASEDRRFHLEHGFSLLLEVPGFTVLVDAGASGACLTNLDRLGRGFRPPDALVLTHGHRDHSGGLPAILARWPELPIHLHPEALSPRFSRYKAGIPQSLGMPEASREAVRRHRGPLHWITQAALLGPGILLSGPIGRPHPEEARSGPFYTDEAGTQEDPFVDELALGIAMGTSFAAVLGCAHAGVVQSVAQLRHHLGGLPCSVLAGGLHLERAGLGRLEFTHAGLVEHGVRQILHCHCAGTAAMGDLRRLHPFDMDRLKVGSTQTLSTFH